MPSHLSIDEVARRTGLTAHTLRYYERIGLIAPVGRAEGGQRRYAAADLAWIDFLLRLRTTRMPISQMQTFATHRRQHGAGPAPDAGNAFAGSAGRDGSDAAVGAGAGGEDRVLPGGGAGINYWPAVTVRGFFGYPPGRFKIIRSKLSCNTLIMLRFFHKI